MTCHSTGRPHSGWSTLGKRDLIRRPCPAARTSTARRWGGFLGTGLRSHGGPTFVAPTPDPRKADRWETTPFVRTARREGTSNRGEPMSRSRCIDLEGGQDAAAGAGAGGRRSGPGGRPRRVRGARPVAPGGYVPPGAPARSGPAHRGGRHPRGVHPRVSRPPAVPGPVEVLDVAVPDHPQLRRRRDPAPRAASATGPGGGRGEGGGRPDGPLAPGFPGTGHRSAPPRAPRGVRPDRGPGPVLCRGLGRPVRGHRHAEEPDAPGPADPDRGDRRGGRG